MLPILLIHGYSSEGKDSTVEEIYGSLPADLNKLYGNNSVIDLNLSRWISLNDGISIDDISFAMDRALKEKHPELLANGFNVIIHSTGALVVRNWIKRFSSKPSPINHFIHLAGANFGSGMAHIGRGQLARWGRLIMGTGRGLRVLNELEFGASKTIDLHRHFLKSGNSMYKHYQVQEFCLAGSQTLPILRPIPIRYLKEDSSDNTVRTSAANLNFNYVSISPRDSGAEINVNELSGLIEKRLNDEAIGDDYYLAKFTRANKHYPVIPFAIVFETAHFGSDIGIVSGKDNRAEVMPLIQIALDTEYDPLSQNYSDAREAFASHHQKTFEKAARLKSNILEWNKQQQYEAHTQIIFRLRDQYGNDVTDFDINIKSAEQTSRRKKHKLEKMIEHSHVNSKNKGTITFYLRTQKFSKKRWVDQLKSIEPLNIEITGYDSLSGDISYLPVNFRVEASRLRKIVKNFATTIIDVEMMRIPSEKVFMINKARD